MADTPPLQPTYVCGDCGAHLEGLGMGHSCAAEIVRLRAELDRAVETRENANAVSVRVEAENRRLREALQRIGYPPEFIGSRSVLSGIAREALR